MFTGVRGYVARHRSKVALGAGVTGALYVAGQQAWATAVQSREEADNIRRGQQRWEAFQSSLC